MKTFSLLLLLLFPAFCFAKTTEYHEIADLESKETQLKVLLSEVHCLYSDDVEFIAAFDTAQIKWEEYCASSLEARFPAKKKTEQYGSVYPIVYAILKKGLLDMRIKELLLWTEGTQEGDVSKGSVKFKNELDEIRKRKVDGS